MQIGDLSSDILLSIFRRMDSNEMVKVMRVCQRFKKIIEPNRALWGEVMLPPRPFSMGWKASTLQVFDQKSNSRLTRISMDVRIEDEYEEQVEDSAEVFIKTVEKSSKTLRILEVQQNMEIADGLADRVQDFPNLEVCRLYHAAWKTVLPRASCEAKRSEEFRDQSPDDDKEGNGRKYERKLKVLWIGHSKFLSETHLYLLDNLVSLVMMGPWDLGSSSRSSFYRRILEMPSKTLKHLDFGIEEEIDQSLPELIFPNLQVLDCYLSKGFPLWMKIPSTSTIILGHHGCGPSLPSCSKIWFQAVGAWHSFLKERCPDLTELRIGSNQYAWFDRRSCEVLLTILDQRKANVEVGMEIDGVKMKQIQTLVIPFKGVEESVLSQLRGLVADVVDIATVSSVIEVEY